MISGLETYGTPRPMRGVPPSYEDLERVRYTSEEWSMMKEGALCEKKIGEFLSVYLAWLEERGIIGSPDGTVDMRQFENTYDPDLIAAQTARAKRVQKNRVRNSTDKEKFLDYHLYTEYLEKIVPFSLIKIFNNFSDEIEDLDVLQKREIFSDFEWEIFRYLVEKYKLHSMLPFIGAPYDDVEFGCDLGISSEDRVLCTIDVSVGDKSSRVSSSKIKKVADRNINGTSVFYWFQKNENDMYEPAESPSLANFPHLLAPIPGDFVSKIIKNLNPSMEVKKNTRGQFTEQSRRDLALSSYIVLYLSRSLDASLSQFSDERTISRYIERIRRAFNITADEHMTPEQRAREALDERFESTNQLRAFFFCMLAFYSKTLEAKEFKAQMPADLVPNKLLKKFNGIK